MSAHQPSSPGARGSLTCGNCGAPVTAADVTCPACGVLLAAYLAPAGATAVDPSADLDATVGDTAATHDVPSPAMTASPPAKVPQSAPVPAPPDPVRHQPRSQSPIGDALRRSRESISTGAGDLASDAVAEELAGMATDDSALARDVEAELAGARVRFDANESVIETDRVDIGHTGDGAPVVVPHAPAPVAATPATTPVQRRPAPATTPLTPTASAPVTEPVATPVPSGQPPGPGSLTPATLVRWIPFILIGCFVLGIGRSLPGFGGVLGFVLVFGLIYVLIKVAAASSRKTTSMPRDDTWNAGRSRWRK